MKYIDIHCHLDFEDYGADMRAVLARMKEKELGAITIGADPERSKKAVEIAEANENIWATIGVHPEDLAFSFDENEFEKLVVSPKVVGIGECGLDYFWRRSLGEGDLSEEEKNSQKELFKKQIEFAIKYDKPLMLHIRSGKNSFDAYDDALEILNNYKKEAGEKLRGNIHFFAGNTEIAKKFLDLRFTMSFTGVITFTHGYDEVIKFIPQNSIMSETDAPLVAPVPYRGKRNEPVYVIEIIKKLAEIRGEDFMALNNAILENACNIFNIVI
jgi:TatD DNase family protein